MRVRPSLHINPIGFLGGRACDVISSQCRVKVPQNWKQHLRNDLNSVDGDVNTQHTLFVVVVSPEKCHCRDKILKLTILS